MFQLFAAWLLETEDLASLRVNARHHMADRAILARRIHALKNEQQRKPTRRVVKLLQFR
jgi:hypothetical protein